MLGECYFFTDKYPEASDAYARAAEEIRQLPASGQSRACGSSSWPSTGWSLQRYSPRQTLNPNLLDKTRPTWDTRGNALKAYESVRLYDPTGPLADDSVLSTADEHFANDRFDDADYFFSLLRTEYPKSEHLINAYIIGLQAKLRKYDGPMYDSTSLLEAEELIDQMLTQFPAELGKERERVIHARQGRAVPDGPARL